MLRVGKREGEAVPQAQDVALLDLQALALGDGEDLGDSEAVRVGVPVWEGVVECEAEGQGEAV